MINYSIIIPHKNIPDLLQKCLDSIPRREDVQIIVVDDNSDANIVDFNNFPGLNDPYIEVIFGKNENGRKGAGYARNLGLKRAKGKWLIFADADDFFMPCFNEALDKYKDDESEIVFFKVTSVVINTFQPSIRHLHINKHLELIQKTKEWDLAYKINDPWGKFIKRNIVETNNILFSEVRCYETIFFVVKTISLASSKIISEFIIYCITSREGSLSSKDSKLKETLLIRFNEIYKANFIVKKTGKKTYFSYSICSLWLEISKVSKLKSLLLIPKMIYVGKLRYVVSNIIKNDIYGFKNLFKKKRNK